jgi:hypothetical protein
MTVPISDKTRRQRKLDRLAFEILAAHHTEPDSWMRYTDWFQLTKAKCGLLGLGNTTFSECIKRLLDQGKIRKSQVEKNRFYQAIFTPRNSSGMGSDRQESSVVPDKAAQALEQLLSRKPLNGV